MSCALAFAAGIYVGAAFVYRDLVAELNPFAPGWVCWTAAVIWPAIMVWSALDALKRKAVR